jgi:hypothetical protein
MGLKTVLQGLFSNKLLLVKQPGDRLKLIDFAQQQSIGSENSRYKLMRRSINNSSGWGSYTNNIESIELNRLDSYMDYELMDTDAILSAALDVYADESTSLGPTGDLLTITTENPKLKKVLTNLFYDVLNLEYNLWYWVRSLAKNGDHFLILNIQDGSGVIEVMPTHPSLVRRVENDDDVHFAFQGSGTGYINFDKNRFELYEVAHFRLLSDSMYLPYGRSMIEGAKKEYKKLTLMEDAMLIHRIMRAPSKRVFKIDVGNINANEVDNHMEEIMNQNKKVPYINPVTGQYNLEYNMQNLNEDYYLPIRGDRSGTTIETLDGLGNDGSIEDIEYIRKKMMQNLKIPFAYLGEESGAEGKSLLAAEDVRFARTIERIQKVIVGELYKIAYVHLMAQGFSNAELLEFELKLHNPSLIYERQKIELLNEKVTLIGNLKETNLFSRRYIYENIFNLSPEEWKVMEKEVITDLKRGFREKQITEEGNDPEVTGKSFGTPHDLASMYVDQNMKNASDKAAEETTIKQLYVPDGRINNEGRPPNANKFGTVKDKDNGRDPFGSKELSTALENYNKHLSVKKTMLIENVDTQTTSQIEMLDDKSVNNMEDLIKISQRN